MKLSAHANLFLLLRQATLLFWNASMPSALNVGPKVGGFVSDLNIGFANFEFFISFCGKLCYLMSTDLSMKNIIFAFGSRYYSATDRLTHKDNSWNFPCDCG